MSPQSNEEPADLRIVTFGKRPELYIFVHDDDSVLDLIRHIRKFARDPLLSLERDDATALTRFIEAQQGTPQEGFRKSDITAAIHQLIQEHLSGIDDPDA